jgi:hypothetical protein
MKLLLMRSTKYDIDKWYVTVDDEDNVIKFTLTDKILIFFDFTKKIPLDVYFDTDTCTIEKEYLRFI